MIYILTYTIVVCLTGLTCESRSNHIEFATLAECRQVADDLNQSHNVIAGCSGDVRR